MRLVFCKFHILSVVARIVSIGNDHALKVNLNYLYIIAFRKTWRKYDCSLKAKVNNI